MGRPLAEMSPVAATAICRSLSPGAILPPARKPYDA